MTLFRSLLGLLWLVLVGYTAVVIARDGANLLPVFFGDIVRVGWPGQFNLDFSCFLILSALWTAWRQGFSAAGLGLAVAAFFLGAAFLLPYLLMLSWKEGGDVSRILLGTNA